MTFKRPETPPMARALLALLVLLAFASPARAQDEPAPEPTPLREAEIRVLLYSGPGPVLLKGDPGLEVQEEGQPPFTVTLSEISLPQMFLGEPVIHLGGNLSTFHAAGQGPVLSPPPEPRHWTLRPVGEAIHLDGRPYRGTLEVYLDGTTVQVVNRLPLEDYLRGVVPKELLCDQPEAMKAQAVLARTYALAKQGGRRYDVKDDTSHQVYGGVEAEDPAADAAIRETAGLVLAYEGRPARHVLYHSTCGGSTEASERVFGSPVPYLQAADDLAEDGQPWCRDSKYASWEASWTAEELRKEVGGYLGKPVPPIRGLRVAERSPSGRVLRVEVLLEGEEEPLSLRGDDLRRVLRRQGKPLPSTRFEAEGLALRGSGWGHGVGMCQWGALGRARAGAGFQEILGHYYPGTEVVPAKGR